MNQTYIKQLSSNPKGVEQRARRLAARHGYHLVKVRGKWENQYGPYMIVNDRNAVESYGMELETVIDYLSEEK